MIDYIKGKIAELTPTSATIETGGIGYLVHISLTTYSALENKESAQIYVYEAIREDAHLLFGFFTKEEREMFLLLISVSGIGANTARMILSSLSISELQQHIAQDNVTAIKSIKGIGLKTAQRVIIDLKDKIGRVNGEAKIAGTESYSSVKQEAAQALMMLGFQQAAISKALEKIFAGSPSLTIEQAIKQALKLL
ncbi:Holliday junction branch migration protein RuvA [Paludibacter sp.]|uniref:Holliday junction branch migration protein RuvA n=1 Tax=Paludibacter sp. TaxID=1898105 RepID=UPI0013540EB7|nr:Holliday junction branch migration protein RuvA [Paludibacter sp.]MTK53538.1 Holliday junction branch migration protein RuvA [Paludibacter sp.]